MTALENIPKPCAEDVQSNQPVSIYEVHLDSWMRVPEEQNRPLTSSEIAPKLTAYLRHMNFTHVQFLSTTPTIARGQKELANYLCEHEIGLMLDAAENWDTAWASETVGYLGNDPLYRQFHHHQITAGTHLAPVQFSDPLAPRSGERGASHPILPLSHELVTQDQPSLIARMPGDHWQKFANLRLLFADMFALPGRKLIFMGDEFGQWNPWNPAASLDWHLVKEGNFHGQLQHWVAGLNHLYRTESALHQDAAGAESFFWIDSGNAAWSVTALLRRAPATGELMLVVFNFTPVPRHNYRVGVPGGGFWKEVLNSDAHEYGGSGQGNLGGVEAAPFGWHFQSHSLTVTLPPLGAVFFKQTT